MYYMSSIIWKAYIYYRIPTTDRPYIHYYNTSTEQQEISRFAQSMIQHHIASRIRQFGKHASRQKHVENGLVFDHLLISLFELILPVFKMCYAMKLIFLLIQDVYVEEHQRYVHESQEPMACQQAH